MFLSNSPASKRKKALTALLATLLITSLCGAFFAELVMADTWLNVKIESPKNSGTYTQTVPVAFTYTLSTGVPIVLQSPEYSYVLDGQERVVFSPEFNGSAYCSTLSGLSNGVHNLTIRVITWQEFDRWKIPSYQGYSTVIFTVDNTPPRVWILSPEPSAYNVSEVPLTFTLSEPASQMAYCLDDGENVTLTNNATLAGLSSGRHTLVVYATDAAGNTGKSDRIIFDVFTPNPFPTTLIAIAIVASATAISFGLVAHFVRTKRK